MFLTKPIRSYEVLIIGRFLIGLSCGNRIESMILILRKTWFDEI